MTEKELKRLSRTELMELLLAQVDEGEKLRAQIEKTEQLLDGRKSTTEQADSIAQAALRLNGVTEAVQAAAEDYLENVKRLSGEGESRFRRAEEEAKQKAQDILAQADEYSRETRRAADEYKEQTVSKVQTMLQKRDELCALLRLSGEGRA